jgi:hypothetical protein
MVVMVGKNEWLAVRSEQGRSRFAAVTAPENAKWQSASQRRDARERPSRQRMPIPPAVPSTFSEFFR